MLKKIFGDDPKATLKSFLQVVFGTLVLAAGVSLFMIPFNLVAGGVTGLAIALNLVIPLEFVTVELLITVLSWAFFILGLIFVGKGFAFKTLVSTAVYPTAVAAFSFIVSPDVLGGYFYLPGSSSPEVALVLATVAGGGLVGAGVAIAMLAGSSTGGVDTLAVMICKYFPKIKISFVTFTIDATVIILGAVAVGNLVISMLGILSAAVSSMIVNMIFLGGRRALCAHVVSEKYEDIRDAVIKEMDRTVTLLDATGGYSGDVKRVIFVSFTMREYSTMMKIIRRIDPTAFVTIERAHEINGLGWNIPKYKK